MDNFVLLFNSCTQNSFAVNLSINLSICYTLSILLTEPFYSIALYFLKDTGSLRMTANSFEIALNTTSNFVTEVCQAISCYLGPKYLLLPKDKEGMREKVAEFEAKFGVTQPFGCTDGTHIPIKCPSENS